MQKFKIFVINPGSTSTKLALFENDTCLYSKTISHDAAVLKQFNSVNEQLPYRRNIILQSLSENNLTLQNVDAFVGRGGSVYPLVSGVYDVDALILEHTKAAVGGVEHPANLGIQLAAEFQKLYGGKCYTVNPPQVDEFQDLARITGIKGIFRSSHLHALNLKETAIRHANTHGKQYKDCNFIVCHIGGGISISAHNHGQMIDGNDIVGGEGPMAPTRCGEIPVIEILKYAKAYGIDAAMQLCTKTGGFVNHFGTSDAKIITQRAENGDKYSKLIWNVMIYQINKYIGSMASVLNGDVDAILLSGGMIHSKDLVKQITESCSWIAPVFSYPGEFEMEALCAGALRVLTGTETVKKYTGTPAQKSNIFSS